MYKLARITIILFFYSTMNLPLVHPLMMIILMKEKESLNRDLFVSGLYHQKQFYARIPKSLTQERLPLNFRFNNCLGKIIN